VQQFGEMILDHWKRDTQQRASAYRYRDGAQG
jgi:hypothetical protein